MIKKLLLSFLLPSACWAGTFDPSAWQWQKTFKAQKAVQARILLDAETYGGSRKDLADLRVTDPQGDETPYVLETEKDEIRDAPAPARLYNLSRTPKHDTRFELDLGPQAQPHNYLFLDISPENKNFRIMVRLEGSPDAQHWNLIKEKGSILDFSESFRLRYTELYYPESDFRYLRLTLQDRDSEPMQVRGASLRRHAHRYGEKEEHHFRMTKSSTPTSALWDLDFGHDKLPLGRLSFEIKGSDFKRRVTLSVPSGDGKSWSEIGNGAVYRYRTPRFHGESLEIHFPEVRTRKLRVEVFHYNDKPIPVQKIRAFGFPRHLRFKNTAAGTYTLHYGNPKASFPRYDLADLAGYLEEKGIPKFKLSPQKTNSGYVPPRKPWTEEHPSELWTMLCGAVLLLGVLVLREWMGVRVKN
ncbi:MAG: DUF3999 family protein [Elusimicrobia bacterium]|nr:DUF3999 family protein [Elusimicrobiota bacterium]